MTDYWLWLMAEIFGFAIHGYIELLYAEQILVLNLLSLLGQVRVLCGNNISKGKRLLQKLQQVLNNNSSHWHRSIWNTM